MNKTVTGAMALMGACAISIGGPALAAGSVDGASAEHEVASAGPVHVLLGVRLWANQWDMVVATRELILTNPADPSSLMGRDRIFSTPSSTEIMPIVYLGLRYGKFIGSASYFAKTSFDTGGVLSEDVDRDEIDVNIGYHVTPNLVASLGYRRGTQSKTTDFAPDSKSALEGVLLGASFSVPVSGPFSAYGSVAYGIARVTVEDQPLANGDDSLDGEYRVAEIGFSYNLSHLLGGSVLKGAALTAGYRTWVVTEDNVPIGTYELDDPLHPVSLDEIKLRTAADGFVIGAVAVF
ncbi:MAG: hypothetical protein KDH15_09805 [Rhodocyclaceae bacterium]|nr:hypothetical protein [Rhodocyclaceae bacterium]